MNQLTRDTPRLSADLPHRGNHGVCWACGRTPATAPEVWQEHDHFDRPEAVFVLLCAGCSAELIGPHPRLYRQRTPQSEPVPGTLPVCGDCPHRDGVRCPKALMFGGPGVHFRPPPAHVHLCIRGGRGRNQSGWRVIFDTITGCTGKETP